MKSGPLLPRNSPSGWESSWNAKDQILICFLNLKHFLCWVYHIRFLCFICLVFLSLKVKGLQLWSVIFFIIPFFLVIFWIQDPPFYTSPICICLLTICTSQTHTQVEAPLSQLCYISVFHWFSTFMFAMYVH